MMTKEKLIDYSIITAIFLIYFYSIILAVYILIASTPYVMPYEVENFLSYMYFWVSDYTTSAVILGILGYIVIYLTTLYIVKKIIDFLILMFFKIKQKNQTAIDDIVNEE